jgi:hypothetical protein
MSDLVLVNLSAGSALLKGEYVRVTATKNTGRTFARELLTVGFYDGSVQTLARETYERLPSAMGMIHTGLPTVNNHAFVQDGRMLQDNLAPVPLAVQEWERELGIRVLRVERLKAVGTDAGRTQELARATGELQRGSLAAKLTTFGQGLTFALFVGGVVAIMLLRRHER